jgi:hypothetical protein
MAAAGGGGGFRKITHCQRNHVLHLAAHNPREQHTSTCAPTSRTYHKWSDEGTPYMTCPCGYKVCIACAEVGMYEEGGAELGKTLGSVGEQIVKDSRDGAVMELLGLATQAQALSSVRSFYALAHAGSKSAALWRTCCDWRSLHAQLAELDDVKLRALCVAAASKDDSGRQLAKLIRLSLVERHGKLTTPPPEVFVGRLAHAAACLYHQNDSDRSKAFGGLVSSAVGAALCTTA